jgi:uncharacterized membrane protein YbhN (UPF0104 family)
MNIAVRIAAIAALVAALWWFVREIDVTALGRALASARIWPLLVAIALNFVVLLGKTVCWRIMLAPRHHVATTRLFRYTVATFAASAIFPGRAGEVLRVLALRQRDGVPAADSAAVAIAEKLLDGITMLLLVAPLPWLLPALPGWIGSAIALCSGVAIVLFIGLYIAAGRDEPHPTASVLRRFLAGMHVLRSGRRLLGAMGTLILTWLAELGVVMSVIHAVDLQLSVPAGLLILFTVNLTIMVPSTPAQIGALEVGALVALDLLHVPREPALAFALLYHALQVIPVIAAGLALELPLVLGREQARSGSEPPAS